MKRKTRKPVKRLKTTARSASAKDFYEEDYFGEESNMRLSRAFVVVLILHIVAVGGILLFNNMKAKQEARESAASGAGAPVVSDTAPPPVSPGVGASEDGKPSGAKIHVLRSGETLSRLSRIYGVGVPEIVEANGLQNTTSLQIGQRLVIPAAGVSPGGSTPVVPKLPRESPKSAPPVAVASKPVPVSSGSTVAAASGGSYTVVKGDNPHAIARKFGVDYQDLLEVNDIEDPRLLQIGQVLVIPEKKN